VIAIFAKDTAVYIHVADAAEVFIPVMVVGELHYGARKSARVKANLERIENLLQAIRY